MISTLLKTSVIAAVISALICLLFLSGCEEQAKSDQEHKSASHGKLEHESHDDDDHDDDDAHDDDDDNSHDESAHHHDHLIIVTSPIRKDLINTEQYVCQIHSCKHIEICALEKGYLMEVNVSEGQFVKKGDLMFKILPVLYEAKVASEIAEADRIKIELDNARELLKKSFVSAPQVKLKEAELAKANANVALAKAELNFADIKAPFDGIADRQHKQLGGLVNEGDVLTTLSDNSLMWVYFPVREARYLEYKAELDQKDSDVHQMRIELKLANGKIFPQPGKIGAVEADFNNVTGNIEFRADFPNPDRLLRNGQTGTILIHRALKDVVVIPQRATYEVLDKRYAYVVDKDNVVHQRDLKIQSVQEDIFVIEEGLDSGDRIILEGIQQVHDGDKIKYEFREPEKVLSDLKYHAE